MQSKKLVILKWPAVAAVAIMGASACSDSNIVYQDREAFNPPADSVSGMLGYYSIADKQTTCGNCHADTQAEWIETAHASAWEDLQASGHASDVCEGCHTVNEYGNLLTAASGWHAVKDSTYLDVQCESCHGPGNAHVGGPASTQPLASIAADTAATNGCGECHNGEHHPFVEQWAMSKHGSGSSFSYAGGRSGCNACHSAQGALVQQFNSNADYLEKDGDPLPIVCVVCHDPHGGPFEAQLRAPVAEDNPRGLCLVCHNRETVPTAGTRGAHAAQGPLVLGEDVGWWPDGFEWLNGLTGSHGDVEVNEGLCATCHVAMFEVTDEATGAFVFQSVGHTFDAIACLDAEGIPTTEECTNDERDFSACASCHLSEGAAQVLYENFKDTLNLLLDQIWVDTDGNEILDPAPTDAGVLPLILQVTGNDKEIDRSDTLFTSAEGILYNAQLAATHDRELFLDGSTIVIDQGTGLPDTVSFSAHFSSGNGVHNPPFLEALLKASIQHAIDFYGLPAPPGVDLTIRADRSQFKR